MAEQPHTTDPKGPINSAHTSNPLISTSRVAVQLGPVVDGGAAIKVRIPAGVPHLTAGYPGSTDLVLGRYPNIVRHRCQSGSAHGIRAELANTEVAHLLEHLVIEALAEEGLSRERLHGSTAWNFAADGQGVYRLKISGIQNDQQLRRAVLAATELIEQFTVLET